jgi:lipopolysaccharide transport system ATP-binding protein
MDTPAIRVEKLSKMYRIGAKESQPQTLIESLRRAAASPLDYLRSTLRPPREEEIFWALRDISFEVKHGEVVGIIGRNGAGKSTLLKILSRITEPTNGRAVIKGRVGSLLEVGTGFHPELTGRENIFLNGAIIGMSRSEIQRKFDEIVDFSGVEKFIDTPVKRYSSGMYVRLAFAVAAHLEPDILIIDEVLAVGDAAFQKKCLGKMGDVAKGGRTVLFVSHQMNAIRNLCGKTLWFDDGSILMNGDTTEIVSRYESRLIDTGPLKRDDMRNAPAEFLSWRIVEPVRRDEHSIETIGPFKLAMRVQIKQAIRSGHHGIALRSADNQIMWAWAKDNLKLSAGEHEFTYTLPGLPLRPGIYFWLVSLYEDGTLLDVWHANPGLHIATQPLAHPNDAWTGVLNMPCEFQSIER